MHTSKVHERKAFECKMCNGSSRNSNDGFPNATSRSSGLKPYFFLFFFKLKNSNSFFLSLCKRTYEGKRPNLTFKKFLSLMNFRCVQKSTLAHTLEICINAVFVERNLVQRLTFFVQNKNIATLMYYYQEQILKTHILIKNFKF